MVELKVTFYIWIPIVVGKHSLLISTCIPYSHLFILIYYNNLKLEKGKNLNQMGKNKKTMDRQRGPAACRDHWEI